MAKASRKLSTFRTEPKTTEIDRRVIMAFIGSFALLTPTSTRAVAAPADLQRPISEDEEVGKLTDLIAGYNAACLRLIGLERQHDELEKEFMRQRPAMPAVLKIRKADIRLFSRSSHPLELHRTIGRYYTAREVEVLRRSKQRQLRDIILQMDGRPIPIGFVLVGTPDKDFIVAKQCMPWPLAQARADAIVAASDQWQKECNTLRERILGANETQLDEQYDLRWKIADLIESFMPQTVAGLKLKAEFAIDKIRDEDSGATVGDMFAWSIVRNLSEIDSRWAVIG